MLKVLPPKLSNLIAAGEVVQRPSSVVKELVENAVDAGADTITILVEDAGRTLLQVIDNGIGMTREEAQLCFERHATSKIDRAEDLESILTYGFRGEALASIAAVATVTMKTRKRGADTGVEVQISSSQLLSSEEISCPEGTNISVRNIFYNVPARRKFLKSENAEFRHIVAEFSHIALCRPDVALKLVHNGKDIYNLRKANSLKQRILEIEGKGLIKELVDMETSTSLVRISGFIGHPEDARKSGGNQYFFVNRRFFRSPYFHKALMKGYEKLIPEGTLPSYYLFFETEPSNVDVNIHPAKTEVKFENETEIFEIITAAVRESLGKNSFIPSLDFRHDTLPDFSDFPEFPTKASLTSRASKINYAPLVSQVIPSRIDSASFHDEPANAKTESGDGLLFEEDDIKDSILMLGGKYLVTTLRSGLLVIHVRRAKERICYERFLKSLDNSEPVTQQILFPFSLELSPRDYSLVTEDPERMRLLGFDIAPVEGTTIMINGLPEGFSSDAAAVKASLDELASIFADSPSEEMLKAEGREKMAAKLARTASMHASCRLSGTEARMLVDSLFACSEPECSPSGKKCMEIITEEELDKRL